LQQKTSLNKSFFVILTFAQNCFYFFLWEVKDAIKCIIRIQKIQLYYPQNAKLQSSFRFFGGLNRHHLSQGKKTQTPFFEGKTDLCVIKMQKTVISPSSSLSFTNTHKNNTQTQHTHNTHTTNTHNTHETHTHTQHTNTTHTRNTHTTHKHNTHTQHTHTQHTNTTHTLIQSHTQIPTVSLPLSQKYTHNHTHTHTHKHKHTITFTHTLLKTHHTHTHKNTLKDTLSLFNTILASHTLTCVLTLSLFHKYIFTHTHIHIHIQTHTQYIKKWVGGFGRMFVESVHHYDVIKLMLFDKIMPKIACHVMTTIMFHFFYIHSDMR